MDRIGAALRDQRHLPARRTALVRGLTRDGHAKLLDRIERYRKRRVEPWRSSGLSRGPRVVLRSVGKGMSDARSLVVVNVHAVQRDVVLIASCAEDFAGLRNPGLNAEQFDHVSGLQRKLLNLPLLECVTERTVDGVHLARLGLDAHAAADGAHFENAIERGRNVHFKRDVLACEDRESGLLDHQVVGARRNLQELIDAGRTGERFPHRAGRFVGERDGALRDGRSGWVFNDASQ